MSRLLQGVVVCNNYSDFLAWTLPLNKNHFDYLVVVTTPEDVKTQKLCEFYHVHCVQCKDLCPEDGQFYKGKGINAGLKLLDKTGDWLIHMDADIILPTRFREMIALINPDTDTIYGMDRYMVKSFEDWYKFFLNPKPQYENNVFTHTNHFDIGTRISPKDYGFWLPIGFFQMWHSSTKVFSYPEQHSDAGRGDMLFTKSWERNKRALLPEMLCYHLDSGSVKMGENWNGRKTPLFAPKSFEESDAIKKITKIQPIVSGGYDPDPKQSLWQKILNFIKKLLRYLWEGEWTQKS